MFYVINKIRFDTILEFQLSQNWKIKHDIKMLKSARESLKDEDIHDQSRDNDIQVQT